MTASVCVALAGCCKKDDDVHKPRAEEPIDADYTPLAVGNYWIYERYQAFLDGTEVAQNTLDSVYVEKDSVIDGRLFYKYIRTSSVGPTAFFMRDSLHYMVLSNGQIVFSSEDFSTVFSSYIYTDSDGDTVMTVDKKMSDKDSLIATPAGVFTTSNFQTAFGHYGSTGLSQVRYMDTRYAKDVGLVEETVSYYPPHTYNTIRKLVRYHLK